MSDTVFFCAYVPLKPTQSSICRLDRPTLSAYHGTLQLDVETGTLEPHFKDWLSGSRHRTSGTAALYENSP